MPLDIKLNLTTTEDCKNLVIEDVTGDYKSDTNPGGWGGNINQSPILDNTSVDVFITAYHFIAGKQYTTSFQVPDSIYYTSFPKKESIDGFKIMLPSDVISTYIANQINIEPNVVLPEEYNVTQDTVEDNIYETRVRINLPGNQNSIISNAVSHSSTCNMRNQVNSLLASIDLSCKDCDKSVFDKALLAKSILEGLENA